MRVAITIVLALLGVALFGGCGSSDPKYSLGRTFGCLRTESVPVTYHLDDSDYFVFDPIARAARGGVLHATIGESSVIVVYERSEGDARRTEARYRALRPSGPDQSGSQSDRLESTLERRRNAVVVWLKPPTERASARLAGCLS